VNVKTLLNIYNSSWGKLKTADRFLRHPSLMNSNTLRTCEHNYLTFPTVSAFMPSRLMSWTRSLILWACAYRRRQAVLKIVGLLKVAKLDDKVFTARCYASAVLAMGLCLSVCLSVSVCVCLSQAGVLLKRQNVGSQKQHHTIPQGV